ncbi:hypothetical protein BH20ACT6_BH20ACT6_21440 [soil metagenome]
MTDDIPPLTRPEDMPPIRTQADLWRHWRALMGPLGFSERLLWLCFMAADGRIAPVLPQINDVPRLPDESLVDSLMQICRRVCDDFGVDSVSVLLSRPGPAGITAGEVTWAQRLGDAAAAAGVTMWPMHVANDHELVTVTPDDLAMPRATSA